MAHRDGPAGSASTGVDGTFASRPDSVAEARVLVRDWLGTALPREQRLIGDVALAVSEACTNVVVHAYPGGGDGVFRVAATYDGAKVRVTVTDGGGGMIPRPDSPGLGLGLPLIASLSDAVEVRPGTGGTGTVLSMRFSAGGEGTPAGG